MLLVGLLLCYFLVLVWYSEFVTSWLWNLAEDFCKSWKWTLWFRLNLIWSTSLVVIKNQPANAGDASLIPRSERSPEKEMAAHSSILAWEIPWTEDPGGLYSPWGCRGVGCDLAIKQQQLGGLGLMVIRWIGIMNTVQLGKLQWM